MMLLKKTYNSNIVALLVVDNQGKMVSVNKKFIEMWNLPQYFFVLRDDNLALEYVSTQFENADKFIDEIKNIYQKPNLILHDLIKLKNGKMFERYSQPLWLKQDYVGRIWLFREILDFEDNNIDNVGFTEFAMLN